MKKLVMFLSLVILANCGAQEKKETNSETKVGPIIAWLIKYGITNVASDAIISGGEVAFKRITENGDQFSRGSCHIYLLNGKAVVSRFGELLHFGPSGPLLNRIITNKCN